MRLLLSVFLLALVFPAQASSLPPEPGSRGVCITEWDRGERIEIPVEVVGTMTGGGPDRDILLVRLLDPRFVDAGVVSGMSGSPVYVGGTLVGAIAFGWQFAREPLAGVTPIARMEAIQATAGDRNTPVRTPLALDQLTSLAAGTITPAEVLALFPRLEGSGAAPITLSGLPQPDGFGRSLLGEAGVSTVIGGNDGSLTGIPDEGGMVAVLLVWGDATVAAAGTVTSRNDDRLLAFGHPLFGLGNLTLPAAPARVLAVQRSFQLAFKMYEVGEPFGALVADRPAGILVRPGLHVAGLPVHVRVKDGAGEHAWQFQVAPHPLLQPLLITFLANACLTARSSQSGDVTVGLSQTVAFQDGRAVELRQTLRGADARARAATLAGALVDLLANSPYPGPGLRRVELVLEQQEDAPGAQVLQVLPSRTSLRAGQELLVTVRLQALRGHVWEERLRLTVPRSTPPGPLDLIVSDGAAWSDYLIRQRGVVPSRFDDQLAAVALLEPATTLVAALENRDRGVAVAGRPQPALPPSWAATLAAGLGRTGLQRLTTSPVVVLHTPGAIPLTGAFRIPLTILDGPRGETPAGAGTREP